MRPQDDASTPRVPNGTHGRSRRDFLTNAAILTAGLSLGCTNGAERALGPMRAGALNVDRDDDDDASGRHLPSPEASGIEHIVLVMMENRSFDHFLGWLPHANGRQSGLTYTDRNGVAHATYPLAPDYQGCGHADPDHGYDGGRVEYDGGRCDGWLRAGDNDIYSIGYYRLQDLPFLGSAAQDWSSFDRYHAAILSATFPNRFIQHSGQTDRMDDSFTLTAMPTIWDRLADRGLTGRYYFSDLPFLLLWGPLKYFVENPVSRPITEFYDACATGDLPQVSYVDPRFVGEDEGTSNDDHPHADVRSGEYFLNQVYTAVTNSPAWKNTVLVINFDEWGGFFDHVPPTVTPISDLERAAGNADGLRGFRTPALVISPFARRAQVNHMLFDHSSVLRMIEWRWGLDPLTVRDQTANNLAQALDFRRPRLDAPQYIVPPVVGAACPAPPSTIASSAGLSASAGGLATTRVVSPVRRTTPWHGLASLARSNGSPTALAHR
jgi:phospholipase C